MYNTFSSSYDEPTTTATLSYEEHRIQVIHSVIDLTPSGRLFKLKAMLQHCKSIKPIKITPFLDNLQLTTICKELLKELSNDPHLQPKP